MENQMHDNLTVQCKEIKPTIRFSFVFNVLILGVPLAFFSKDMPYLKNMPVAIFTIYVIIYFVLTTPILNYILKKIFLKYNAIRGYIQSIIIDTNGIQIIETKQHKHNLFLHNNIQRISYVYEGSDTNDALSKLVFVDDNYKNTLYIETKDKKVYKYRFIIDTEYNQQIEVIKQITILLQRYSEQYSFEWFDYDINKDAYQVMDIANKKDILKGYRYISDYKIHKTTKFKDIRMLLIEIIALLVLTPFVALFLTFVVLESKKPFHFSFIVLILFAIFIVLLYIALIVMIIKRKKMLSSYKK